MISYNALISACRKGEQMRRAFDFCVAMLRQALKPDRVNYSALISAWEKGEELRWAFDVFAAMLRPALVPSLIRDMHLRGGLGDYAATAEGQDGRLRSRGGTVDGRLVPTQHRIREWSARRITTISVPDSWPGPPRVCVISWVPRKKLMKNNGNH